MIDYTKNVSARIVGNSDGDSIGNPSAGILGVQNAPAVVQKTAEFVKNYWPIILLMGGAFYVFTSGK